MTVVAIWSETADSALWSVADTRISAPGETGGTTIRTDSGAKLFALPISCSHLSSDPSVRRMPYYTTSVGFAFAGDVLPATMTYATASTFLQNLLTAGPKDPPMLRDIGNLVGQLAERFSKESLSSSNGRYGKFECAVFGFCHHLQRFVTYHIPHLEQPTFAIEIKEAFPTADSDILVLGSGRTRLNEKITFIRNNGDRFLRTGRIPKLALEAIVDEDQGDVGGSLSIGIATTWRYDLYSWLRPVEYGKPAAFLSFNGIDLSEIGHLGQFMIAPTGMV